MSNLVVALSLLSISSPIDPARVEWNLPADLAVLSAKTTSRVSISRATAEWTSAPRPGSQSVRLHVEGRSTPIYAFVKLGELKPVMVAARRLVAGETLREGDFRRELRAKAGIDFSLVGARVRADVPKGEVILTRHVELPPPEARGTPVTVVSIRGAVRVEVPGRLHESCRKGERCLALTSISRQPIAGRLADSNTFILETP